MTSRVGVVIVNYNAGPMLERCLAALARQTRRPERVLLVDNGSEPFDHARIESSYPGIEILRLDRNAGFAAANNLAVARLADVEWVALLNPDAYPEPGWLDALLVAAHEKTGYDLFGSRMFASDGASMDGTGDVYHVSGAVWRRDHGKPAAVATVQAGDIFAPSAAAALVRREAFLACGGFDERFFCYMEDVDLGFRLRLRGSRSHYVPGAVVVHEGSGVVGEYSPFQVYHGHRNLVWVYFKNMPGGLLWLYLPQHLLYNLASIPLFIWRGRGGAILRAKRDALRGLGEVWRQRRRVQATRVVSARELRRSMAHGWLGPYLYRNE